MNHTAYSVGATPPMGWNSWNNFGCSPSESLIKGVADAMVSSGMAAVGYQYVNIDDCWMSGRDSSGNLRRRPDELTSITADVSGSLIVRAVASSPNLAQQLGLFGIRLPIRKRQLVRQ
jgi:hypothetical protein